MRMVWVAGLLVGLASGGAWAQLAPPRQVVDPGSGASSGLSSQSAEALTHGQPANALTLADKAIASDARNPWGHYDRAAALADLGRVDEAVAEYKVAQQTFSDADAWGRSLTMYGRANVLAQAGRCPEARAAYEEYATFVERTDPHGADLARRYAQECKPHTR